MHFFSHATTIKELSFCSFSHRNRKRRGQHSTENNFGYYLIEKFYFPTRSPMVNTRDKIGELSVFEEAVAFLIQIWLFQSQDITLQF